MLTQEQLGDAFRVYFDEMQRCQQSKCYWALLHVVIVLPDICGALECPEGIATRDRYKDWCKRYLVKHDLSEDLSEEEWYEIRCVVLHQGRTSAKKGRYKNYSFSQPTEQGKIAHRVKRDSGLAINLDVGKMATEIRAAIALWFDDLCQASSRASSVAANLPLLVAVPPRGDEPIKDQVIRATLPTQHTTSNP